ncbi:Lipopolysaccharide export system protein LptA [Calidithermus terrae]|uniref:Lipopolysaccharide export system protein LptA n=1 Tax=Calidithermus terrae TaxID=1408545 RepID=A0A399EEY0_9DEIN|nr:LptA/OstA family protein [Calidithermus terrae]RIH83177.1 Lipopolysaccharide export system protein LptA [Calidithermus terrae]
MKKTLGLTLLLLAAALSQSSNVRIIDIQSPGGEVSGNPRNGPLTFTNPTAGGVVGKVKDLQINASKATLQAPSGKTLEQSKGERTATFEGSITVKRDRMTAKGPKLTYQESTGLGVLTGPAQMRQEPKDDKSDPVEVAASKMTFDVDTDVSTSEGEVTLKNGNQEGQSDAVYYEEKRGLAIFTDGKQVVLTRKRSGADGNLIIRAKEVRSLTNDKRLIAMGGVTLVDGNTTVTGDSLTYDDKTGIAIVSGKPAVSENTKEKVKLSTPVIEHNVNKHQSNRYTKPFTLPVNDFQKTAK